MDTEQHPSPQTERVRAPWLRIALWLLVLVAVVLVLGGGAFLAWGLTPQGPSETALRALESTTRVDVTKEPYGYVFTPRAVDTTLAVVLYPGGHVDYRSYAPLAQAIAERNVRVVVVQMPLSLAFFKIDAAAQPMAAAPDLRWFVAGHSLGGIGAQTYASDAPKKGWPAPLGLALLASYVPTDSAPSSLSRVRGLVMTGSNDGLVPPLKAEPSIARLGPGSNFHIVRGGNHAQWGSYGLQSGDGSPTITPAQQWSEGAAVLVAWMREAANVP